MKSESCAPHVTSFGTAMLSSKDLNCPKLCFEYSDAECNNSNLDKKTKQQTELNLLLSNITEKT